MFTFALNNTLRRAILTLALAASTALGALAPGLASAAAYHVELDTSAYQGDGYLDLQFLALLDATPATATLSNFSGAVNGLVEQVGNVSGTLASGLSFANGDGGSILFSSITLGGRFSFDLDFGGEFLTAAGDSGTTFSIGLLTFDGDNYAYLGGAEPQLRFELTPAYAGSAGGVDTVVLGNLASVSAVPEPSTWLMLLAGLAVLGFAARRRQLAPAAVCAA